MVKQAEWTAFDLDVLAGLPGPDKGVSLARLAADIWADPMFKWDAGVTTKHTRLEKVQDAVVLWGRLLWETVGDDALINTGKTAYLSHDAHQWVRRHWSSLCEQAGV